jgi:hypothetical protein
MRKDWTLIRKIKGGHGYWRHKNGEVGITDDSGTYPEDTEPGDDPPLLLDRTRPVQLGTSHNSIPLKHLNGRTSGTPASGFEALWVATQFHMEIEAYEKGSTWPLRIAVVDAAQMTEALAKQNIGSLRQMWLAESLKGLVP